jgi:hypothetical protein
MTKVCCSYDAKLLDYIRCPVIKKVSLSQCSSKEGFDGPNLEGASPPSTRERKNINWKRFATFAILHNRQSLEQEILNYFETASFILVVTLTVRLTLIGRAMYTVVATHRLIARVVS